MKIEEPPRITFAQRAENAATRALLGGALLLPYTLRVRLVGRLTTTIVAPLAGWRSRIRNNLALAMPEMSASQVEEIVRRVPDNVGRTLIEIYSGDDFLQRAKTSPIEGPGLEALEAARVAGRPMVLVTAHFGNYDAVRGTLFRAGYPMGALYKPMKNPAFNKHYLKAISVIGNPLFATDSTGIGALIKHLKSGGIVGIVADVSSRKAPLLSFFGKPAHTPLSAAEWAVKFNAVMIPIFGLRQDDGLTFRLHVAEEIPHGPAEEMMQLYNDVVEDMARAHPEQWFWIHRRWKRRADTT